MGRTSDEEGETSAKTCRSDDSSDRPLKKARYVWQIKGKYHLKKPENAEGAKLYIADESSDGYALHPIEVAHHESGTQEHDGHTIGVADTEVSKSDSACVLSPVATEIHSPMESEDLNPVQLLKWQARQVARCFVDNTINRVLEDMGFTPLPVDADDLMEDFAMSGLRRNDEHLEDTAVRMAIHSHGLQRAVADMTGGNQNHNSNNSVADSCIYNCSLDPMRVQNSFSDDPINHMNRWCVPEYHNQNCPQCDQSPNVKHMLNSASVHEECSHGTGWNQPSDTLKCTSNDEFCNIGFMNKKSASCDDTELDAEHVDVEIAGNFEDHVFTGDMKLDDKAKGKNCASFEHTDFLDKAVAVAIQKKGLSTLSGIEYG